MSAPRRLALLLGLCLASACGPSGPAHPYLEGGPPEHVLLITVGSLRADHLRAYAYEPKKEQAGVLGRDLSSYWIDNIFGNATPVPGEEPPPGDPQAGVVFDNAQASSSATGPSMASMFTGLLPSKHGVLENGRPLDESMTTLAELFKAQGYETGAFLGVRHLAGLRQGFDTLKAGHKPAMNVMRDAQDWLRETLRGKNKRFFVWVHFNDVRDWHMSYPRTWPSYELGMGQLVRATKGTRKAFYRYVSHLHGLPPEEPGESFPVIDGGYRLDITGKPMDFTGDSREEVLGWVDRYDARLHMVDLYVYELVKFIEGRKLPGRKLYMFSSPHGEALGDHDYVGHDRDLYEAQLRVPLMLRFSGVDRPRGHVPSQVRLTDLFPTIAVMFGLDPNDYHEALDGEPLWPLLPGAPDPEGQEPRVAYAERRPIDEMRSRLGWTDEEVWSVRTPRHKLIVRESGPDELYLMEGTHREKLNLGGREPAHPAEVALRRLLDERRAWVEANPDKLPALGEIPPGWETELFALGELVPDEFLPSDD